MPPPPTSACRTAAVVLAGGTAARLDGADKASVEVDGRTLLEHALDATAACDETVVVGDEHPTGRPVTFAREDPSGGGPAAALLAGIDALSVTPDVVVVLAVDMPRVTAATLARLVAALGAAEGAAADGAVLVDAAGRHQPLCAAYRGTSLRAVRPGTVEECHGLPVRRLLAPLTLVEVAAREDEARDVDTWADLRDLRDVGTTASGDGASSCQEPVPRRTLGGVDLHDWIDELCDALDLEDVEVDEGLILDLARDAAHSVEKKSAPITTYLLGYAAAQRGGGASAVEELAGRASMLAEKWGGEDVSPDDFDEGEITSAE